MLGAFEDPDIIHVDDTVDPVRDLEIITEELRLKVCIISNFLNRNKLTFGPLILFSVCKVYAFLKGLFHTYMWSGAIG